MRWVRVAIVLLTVLSPSRAAELHTLAGKVLSGELVSIGPKEIVFRAQGGPVTLPVTDVLQLELQRDVAQPAGKYSDVELIDGSLLHATKLSFKGKEVEVTLVGSDRKTSVPLTSVASILNDAQDPIVRQDWQEKVLAKKGNQDMLAIKLNGVLNPLEGTLGDTASEKALVSFEYESGGDRKRREIDPNRIQGLVFMRSLGTDAPPPACKVFDANQNVFVATKLVMGPSSFTVTTVAGPSIDLPKTAVVRLDYSNDKVVFLSDLKPAELIEKSRQGRKDNLHLNKNLENGSLQIEDQVYNKGLAIHSHTELTYALDGKYQKLEAVLGMDAAVGGDGQPVVKIEADGKELFSATVSRKDKRRELNLPVKGVKQLRIVVSSTGLFDFGDHIDLANAKLSK